MPDHDQPQGALGERPRIDYERNIREWHAEVRDRIRRMVTWSLDQDRPVAEQYLRKLGPDGRAAFQRALNGALDQRIAALAPPAEAEPTPPEVEVEPEARAEPASKPVGRRVVPLTDWSAQRCDRPSLAVRAQRQGWVAAALLVTLAALWLRQQIYR